MKITDITSKFINMVKTGVRSALVRLLILVPQRSKKESNSNNEIKKYKDFNNIQNEYLDATLYMDGEVINIDLENIEDYIGKISGILERSDNTLDISSTPFALATHWKKDEKGNGEYKRTVYRFIPNKNFNFEYYEGYLSKITEIFRNNGNLNEIFEQVETSEQVRTFSQEEEKHLNTSEDILDIEGTNIRLAIKDNNQSDVTRTSRVIENSTLLVFCLMHAIDVIKKNRKVA